MRTEWKGLFITYEVSEWDGARASELDVVKVDLADEAEFTKEWVEECGPEFDGVTPGLVAAIANQHDDAILAACWEDFRVSAPPMDGLLLHHDGERAMYYPESE